MIKQYEEVTDILIESVFSNYKQTDSKAVTSLKSWEEWKLEGQRILNQGWLDPTEYLIRLLNLNEFEQFCLLFLKKTEIQKDFIYQKLKENDLGEVSPVALMSLYEGKQCFHQDLFRSFLKGSSLWEWIIEKPDCDGPKPYEAICLEGRTRNLLLAEQWEDETIKEFGFWIYQENKTIKKMKGNFGQKDYYHWSSLFGKKGGIKGCILRGSEGIGKKTQVHRYVQESGIPVFYFNGNMSEYLSGENQKEILKRIIWECRIEQAVLCIEWKEDGQRFLIEQAWQFSEKYLHGFLLLLPEEKELTGNLTEMFQIILDMPNLKETEELWREIKRDFPCAKDINPEEFAGTMSMTPGQIVNSFFRAESFMKRDGLKQIEKYHLKEACRNLICGKMKGKAVEVKAEYGFEDLILPLKQRHQLKEACNQVKNRYHVFERWGFSNKNSYGTGTSIVFSGSPGTGKTMAAQVMAKELGIELYKIDLCAVVSKYIGETEKNLNLIFDEGRRHQAILFFDEADALFSKRIEIKDSNDKYSNMEAAFLLQKMEEYTGITILATNYLQNIDEAFKRRFTYIIEFPFPDKDSRRQLWQSTTPKELPLAEDVDFDFLSENFELSGSQIKNSLINAAFLAAGMGEEKVAMEYIFKSIEKELHKTGRNLAWKDYEQMIENV